MTAAHEQVRVARRLAELPLVRERFAAGRLSYSKVRALTRMATPATEAELVGLAAHATAAHLDRIARARRAVDTTEDESAAAERRHEARHLHHFWDDDGSLVLTARFSPEDGALVLEALAAATQATRSDAAVRQSSAEDSGASGGAPAGDSGGTEGTPAEESGYAGESPAEDSSATRESSAEDSGGPTPRWVPPSPAERADALVSMAEAMLRYGPQFRDGGDRYQVVVMADAAVLRSGGQGRCHIDDGPALAPETARRLGCDASLVAMLIGENAEALDVGRTTQSIPRAIRRALRVRDGGCRFPGCDRRRFTDGHHIQHWADGGPTSLQNLVLLCRSHHRAIHEGGYRVRRAGPGRFEWTTPDGEVVPGGQDVKEPAELDVAELNRRLGLVITSETGATLWGGEKLDLGLAIDALLCLENREPGTSDGTAS